MATSDLVSTDILAYLEAHERKSLLRFITCGSVDDGKSTLIGRLLHDSQMLFEDQLAALEADSRRLGTQGEELDFALLLDGLAAEREQGITIDVAYRFFSTDHRKYIVADTPGHEQYTRNMVTGASTADCAVILIDARKGVLTQTRRHTYLLNFIALDAEDWRRLVARVRQPAGELARRLTEAQPRLHGAFARTPLAAAGWTWEDVVWVLHALLIGNRGLDLPAEVDAELVGEAAAGPLLAPERPGGGHYWLGGHESGPDVPAMEAPGWYGTARGDWELGHFGPGRGHAGHTWIFAPPAHGLAVLRALLEGPRPEEEVIAQCGLLEREQCRATLAELVQAGLAEREGERFRLTFPVFGPGDTEVLSAPLREVTRPLLEEVLLPTWADLAALFDELGYRHCREQYVIWRHWLSALIVGEALRFLVRQGTLPELGETPPAPWSYAAAWGTTLWR